MSLEQPTQIDMSSGKDAKAPAIAARLEKEGAEIKAKRMSLSKEDVEKNLQAAEERRQKELEKKVETAKELEGVKGKVDAKAAAADAPPAGSELPNSPTA